MQSSSPEGNRSNPQCRRLPFPSAPPPAHVFASPVLAAGSQRRECTAGERWSWDGKLGCRAGNQRAIRVLLVELNRCRKTCCKIGANTASSRLRFLLQNRGSHSNKDVPVLCPLLGT